MKRLSPHANIIQLHELILWVMWIYYSICHVVIHLDNLSHCFSDKETGTVSLICELMEMNIYEFIQGKTSCMWNWNLKMCICNVFWNHLLQDEKHHCLKTQLKTTCTNCASHSNISTGETDVLMTCSVNSCFSYADVSFFPTVVESFTEM